MNTTGIFVIGDENAVFGFGLLGIAGRAVTSQAEARAALAAALADQSLAIVLISDTWAEAIRADLEGLMTSVATPLLVEIPGSGESGDRPSLRKRLQQTLGIPLAET